MKPLFLFTLSSVLCMSLIARENPFEATNAYEEEAARIVELNEQTTKESMQEAQYIKEIQRQMQEQSKEQKIVEEKPKVVEKVYTKKEVDSLIKKTEIKAKEIVKKELKKTKPVAPTQVVYVKPRTDVHSAMVSKEILPFLKIDFNDDKLVIHTEHKVSKKFTSDTENKIAIDYKGTISFNTKRDTLDSKNFKVITIGNHEKEGFFRVVIELVNKPTKYNVDYKNGLISINRLD